MIDSPIVTAGSVKVLTRESNLVRVASLTAVVSEAGARFRVTERIKDASVMLMVSGVRLLVADSILTNDASVTVTVGSVKGLAALLILSIDSDIAVFSAAGARLDDICLSMDSPVLTVSGVGVLVADSKRVTLSVITTVSETVLV